MSFVNEKSYRAVRCDDRNEARRARFVIIFMAAVTMGMGALVRVGALAGAGARITTSSTAAHVLGIEPVFDVPVENVTVKRGHTVVLPCMIDHLGKYKVAWLDQTSNALTFEDRRVIDDSRFTIVRPGVRQWNLQIRDALVDDEGLYRCTINTNPIRNKIVFLHVNVPSEIIETVSSNDVIEKEGASVILVCRVSGIPLPVVTWYRLSASAVQYDSLSSRSLCNVNSHQTGEILTLRNVTRHCDDTYVCVADNKVSPAVSRKIKITVEFPPEVVLPNNRISQSRGRETILECVITACPQALNYWEKNDRRIVSSSYASPLHVKYRIEAYSVREEEGEEGGESEGGGACGGFGKNTVTLSLRIQITDADDYGEYKCVAANSLGRAEGTMHLQEYVESDNKYDLSSDMSAVGQLPARLVVSLNESPTSGSQLKQVDDMSGKSVARYRYNVPNDNALADSENVNRLSAMSHLNARGNELSVDYVALISLFAIFTANFILRLQRPS